MKSLTKDELVYFEFMCDSREVPVDERISVIEEVFGRDEAVRYQESRCKILAFPARAS